MSIEETQARNAGPAPTAPGMGPLLNVSHTPEVVPPAGGQQISAEDDTTANEKSPQQSLFVTTQQEAAVPQVVDDIPVFDAGPVRIDLMTK